MIILRHVFHYTKNPGEILEKYNSVCDLNLQSSWVVKIIYVKQFTKEAKKSEIRY